MAVEYRLYFSLKYIFLYYLLELPFLIQQVIKTSNCTYTLPVKKNVIKEKTKKIITGVSSGAAAVHFTLDPPLVTYLRVKSTAPSRTYQAGSRPALFFYHYFLQPAYWCDTS